MKKIIEKIFSQPELKSKPPVFVDIGASEAIHPKWKRFAKYSICVAFDADERDFQFIEKEQSSFRKLYVYNSIALDKDSDRVKFYLTKSPYCSSTLEPDIEKLKPYIFSNLFEIDKIVEQKAAGLQNVLSRLNIEYIDWFKTDSQGIDLRLFKSINDNIRNNVLVAEFEPGIIDAYKNEDKFSDVLNYMTSNGFWMSDVVIKGIPRISWESLNSNFGGKTYKKLIKESLKKSPGWGEMTFINTFDDVSLGIREYLLGWLFSTFEKHYSFALVIAEKGLAKFNREIFDELKKISKNLIKKEVIKLKFAKSVFEKMRKIIKK